MRILIHRCTQTGQIFEKSGHFFVKSGHFFFYFQKRGEDSPAVAVAGDGLNRPKHINKYSLDEIHSEKAIAKAIYDC